VRDERPPGFRTSTTIAAGAPLPNDPPSQSPPRNGTGPRIDVAKAGKRLGRVSHRLLGYRGDDGYPIIVAVGVGRPNATGLPLTCAADLPIGSRRAGLLGHSYRRQLVGFESRQYTGWLEDCVYAPHTATAVVALPLRVLLLLINGLLARQALKRAKREAATRPRRSPPASDGNC